ncbi:MAG: LysR family transcriptional regulator [Hyphomicrobiales bacterium]|nr:LysR family transcriptional regulator [Hyphomicrobiales bacterium]
MNLQQLKSLAAILECKSFSAAASKIGLSHSAISLHMKSLEDELGQPLFDRSTRPPTFLASGQKAAELAQKALRMIDDVRLVGSGRSQINAMTIGVVPTTLQDILPYILGQIQRNHPDLQINVKSGLSGDLTSQVLNQELDLAFVTSPSTQIPELNIQELAEEPLYAIGNKSEKGKNDMELLQSRPFISFSRKTWLGQQILARLQSRGIYVDEIMEINSLDAIERMVGEGFGVSIVPQRFLAKSLSNKLYRVPFCNPQEVRRLVLIRRNSPGGHDRYNRSLQLILNIVDKLRYQQASD